MEAFGNENQQETAEELELAELAVVVLVGTAVELAVAAQEPAWEEEELGNLPPSLGKMHHQTKFLKCHNLKWFS